MFRRFLLASQVVAAVLFASFGPTPIAEAQRTIPVNIESQPPGATVWLDSATGPALGTTPMQAVRVATGSHTLIFRLEGHEEARLPVNVRRRRETFRAVLNPLGTISIVAGNDSAQSAAVRIDGQPVGNVPYRSTVQPGRHLVQVGREGFVTFTQWVELAGGQVLTLPVMLEREAPSTGSVLVAADVSGAPVFVDGAPRGSTPTVIENLPVGEHVIEIRPDGLPVHRETVRIVAGERASINPTLRPRPAAGGSLRVIANVPNAVISLDGEPIGNAPATRESVPPGEHILEATAEGYMPVQQPVTIEAGQQRVVSLRLEREQRAMGRIVVNATVDGALVVVDGEEKGSPPVVVENPTPGTHAIAVRAQGYQEFRTTCEVRPGRDCEILARMQPVGTPVRVEANARGAQFYVDGDLQGPVPWEGTLPVGEHRIEVRAEGFETHVEQVQLVSTSSPRTFNVALRAVGDVSEEERVRLAAEMHRARTGAVTHGAAPLPVDLATLDLSIGWPFLAELRLGVGVLDFLDAGFAMRTFGRLTEFEGRVKIGTRVARQIALGAQARFGGGIGLSRDPAADVMMMMPDLQSHPTNTWFFTAEGLMSLNFSDRGAFTLWLGVDAFTDRWDFHASNSDDFVTTDRQNQTRLRLGGSLELVLSRHWNAWALLEGILVGPDNPRRIFGDIYGFGNEDTELYFRLGLTHKF